MSAYRLDVTTRRGSVLNGVLFRKEGVKSESVLIAITGIHGNFCSNPFYCNIGETLSGHSIGFIYAQTAEGYIFLTGNSLGANKIIYYLSRHHDESG